MRTDEEKEEIGRRIRACRERKGLTQGQLAALLGTKGNPVPTATVSRWERGGSEPQRYWQKLCEALDTTMEHLVYGERLPSTGGDMRTEEILAVLGSPVGQMLHPREKEALAIALHDSDADAATIGMFLQALYGSRARDPKAGKVVPLKGSKQAKR